MNAGSGQGRRGAIRAKNQAMAAQMKAARFEKPWQRCPQCYRIVSRETYQSRYTHICRG